MQKNWLNEEGFTLVEMLVSISVIVILSAISIANLQGYKKISTTNSSAKKLSSNIRKVEGYAIGLKDFKNSGSPRGGWGIRLSSVAGQNFSYTLFAETSNTPDYVYDGASNKLLDVSLEKSSYVRTIVASYFDSAAVHSENKNNINIVFEPPDPKVHICDDAGECKYVSAEITISSSDNSVSSKVYVNNLGLASMEADTHLCSVNDGASCDPNDCTDGEIQCDGSCVTSPKARGTACETNMECDGAGSCTCQINVDHACGAAICTNNDGVRQCDGTCLNPTYFVNGTSCGVDVHCENGFCVSSCVADMGATNCNGGNVCKNSDGTVLCDGSCLNPTNKALGTSCGSGKECNGSGVCQTCTYAWTAYDSNMHYHPPCSGTTPYPPVTTCNELSEVGDEYSYYHTVWYSGSVIHDCGVWFMRCERTCY